MNSKNPPTNNTSPKIFISFSLDQRGYVEELSRYLEYDYGYRVWFSSKDSDSKNIIEQIDRNLKDSDFILLILSPSYFDKARFVRKREFPAILDVIDYLDRDIKQINIYYDIQHKEVVKNLVLAANPFTHIQTVIQKGKAISSFEDAYKLNTIIENSVNSSTKTSSIKHPSWENPPQRKGFLEYKKSYYLILLILLFGGTIALISHFEIQKNLKNSPSLESMQHSIPLENTTNNSKSVTIPIETGDVTTIIKKKDTEQSLPKKYCYEKGYVKTFNGVPVAGVKVTIADKIVGLTDQTGFYKIAIEPSTINSDIIQIKAKGIFISKKLCDDNIKTIKIDAL